MMLLSVTITFLYIDVTQQIQQANREVIIAEFMEDYNKEMYDGFLIWLHENEIKFDSSNEHQLNGLWVRYLKSIIYKLPTEV